MNIEKSRLDLHFIYVTIILLFCLIIVATDRWTDKANFTDYLTNVATMISVVLALVAIFYSFISNDGLSKGLGNIFAVSESVQATNRQIEKFAVEAAEFNNLNHNNVHRLEAVERNIGETVRELKSALETITTKTGELHSAVKEIPSRMEQIEIKLDGRATNIASGGEPAGSEISAREKMSDKQVTQFFERSPLVANLLMYACVVAAEQKKSISLDEIARAADLTTSPLYLQGYFVAMWSNGIVGRSIVSGQGPRKYRITYIHDALKINLKEHMLDYIGSEYRDDAKTRERWLNRITVVENLLREGDAA